jgi:hypothetical protein
MSVSAISSYVKTHERLLIVIIIVALLGWGTNKGLNIYGGSEQSKVTSLQTQLDGTKQQAAAAQQSATDAKTAAQVTAAQANQDKVASVAVITALSQQNASLSNQIIQRGQQTQKQQTTDLNATIPELSTRFKSLVPNVIPTDVVVAADGKTVNIGQDTAEKSIAQLELVPSLQADNSALTTQVKNGQTELDSLQKTLDSQSSLTDAQAKVIAAQDSYATLLATEQKQSDAVWQGKLDVEKTNTKKAYLKGFKWGAITGFIGGLFAGHAL